MSMQHRLPDQVVRADPWTLFCAECSQKMRVLTATPAEGGRERAPTSASAVTEKGSTWPFIDGTSRPRGGFASFHAQPKIVHENDCTRDNPDDKAPS